MSSGIGPGGVGGNVGNQCSNATLLSKITFWWMTPLLRKGYTEPLELEDLGTLPEDDSSRTQYDQFLIIYQSNKARQIINIEQQTRSIYVLSYFSRKSKNI